MSSGAPIPEVIATKVAAEMRAAHPAGDVIEGPASGMRLLRRHRPPAWSPQIDGSPERLRDPRGAMGRPPA